MSELEPVEEFRARARAFAQENLQYIGPVSLNRRNVRSDDEELAEVGRERELQRMLYDARLTGVCWPVEYGGLGLTPDHRRALNEELTGYEFPRRLQVPTFVPCAAVLLEFGTDEQKRVHIPAILKGEEIWMQLLSEPSGGSDVAGALTTAARDGEEWVLNGSKIWTTGAWWSDWGLCLARTNWDVPKHRGLTVFMLPLHQPGIDVHRIEMLNGSREFCQEFLSDVRVPDADRIGEVDEGWTVGIRWMSHERTLYNSPLVTYPPGTTRSALQSLTAVARDAGRLDDPLVRDLVGEARMLELVGGALDRRVTQGIHEGVMPEQSGGLSRIFIGTMAARRATIAFEIAGASAAAWSDDEGELSHSGTDFLIRQTGSIGGGTVEMARNVISERVLGMPRERTNDRDVAFRDVPRSGK